MYTLNLRLLDGCSAEDRPALLYGPPVPKPTPQAAIASPNTTTMAAASFGNDGSRVGYPAGTAGTADYGGGVGAVPNLACLESGEPRGLPALIFCELRGGQCQQVRGGRGGGVWTGLSAGRGAAIGGRNRGSKGVGEDHPVR